MNNKGLTLVEVLATLIILGILSTIVIPNIYKIVKTKKTEIEEYKESAIKEAAQMYVTDQINEDTDIFTTCDGGNCSSSVNVSKLIEDNYLSEEYDTYNSKAVNIERTSKANGNYTYEYTIETSS